MNILVFDTETISIDKPYCYNIGYVIYNTETEQVLVKRDFVIEQIWNNKPLFNTAYYYDKRPLYVSSMRGRRSELIKYGFAQQKMIKDILQYNVVGAYAFNSRFDDKVFEFNANNYGCKNALDTIPVFDIRGYAMTFLVDNNYKNFCEEHAEVKKDDGTLKFVTDADGYKTTAESFYCYLNNQSLFNEAHTALQDSEIELEILTKCIELGAKWQTEYDCPRCVPRNRKKKMKIKKDGQLINEYDYVSKTERKNADGITISLRWYGIPRRKL